MERRTYHLQDMEDVQMVGLKKIVRIDTDKYIYGEIFHVNI